MRKRSIKREFELFGYHEEQRQDANRNDAGDDSRYMSILKQLSDKSYKPTMNYPNSKTFITTLIKNL